MSYPIDPHIQNTKNKIYLKLPSIFDPQPQRVSWSDNKLASLSGRGDRSSAFLGDDTELIFDDRQRLDITLVVIIYLVTPQVHPVSKED